MRSTNKKHNHYKNQKLKRTFIVILCSIIASLIVYSTAIYRFLVHGVVFSGEGDGFRQMMPFQMYLYEHFSQLTGMYDASFGLGGDFVKDLAYYYGTSPFAVINFIGVWIAQHGFGANPSNIAFWPSNQLIVAIVKTSVVFYLSYKLFSYLKFRRSTAIIATILFAGSTVTISFNFTWSYYGDLLIFLPLSILGIERLYKEKKPGLYIFAIALTLFSNFYFSYYQAILMFAYFLYRVIFPYNKDLLSRWQKCYITIISTLLSLLIGVWGFYTGVSSFLHNDRKANPNFSFGLFRHFETPYHLFSNGFFITVTVLTITALLSFKLYRHYYYRLFAISTWIMLIGSMTPYFDSMFNGFSTPQRRWVYIFAFTTAGLIAAFIQHLSELSLKSYLLANLPSVVIMIIMLVIVREETMNWMWICFLIMIYLFYIIQKKRLLTQSKTWIILISLFALQQFVMLLDQHHNTLHPYETTMAEMSDDHYRSHDIEKRIKQINHAHQDDPLNRIDYMSSYNLNSAMVYHYNGIALYSSIFDGKILDYYDNLLQINMPSDKNSTYRLLSDRANLMALWNVKDRLRYVPDDNLPYGFKTQDLIHDPNHLYQHSRAQFQYPAAHITNKIYNSDDLHSPLDREQAMLKGVVFDQSQDKPTQLTPNANLKKHISSQLTHAKRRKSDQIEVTRNDGGITYHLPKKLTNKYKDLYFEMHLELKSPDIAHDVKINHYVQNRNPLTYQYRRFVTPVTYRVKSASTVHLKLPEGVYDYQLKGVYGENYHTLREASKSLQPVKVQKERNGYTIHKHSKDSGYIVLPMAYREGMKAYANDKNLEVRCGNGIMTVIKADRGVTHIHLVYRPPYLWLLLGLTVVGIGLALLWKKYLSSLK